MQANIIDYHKMTDKLFYGVARTREHMNEAACHIKNYIINSGFGETVSKLGIGYREIKRLSDGKILSADIVWLKGDNVGNPLTVAEIENIGIFMRGGAFYEAFYGAEKNGEPK